MDSSTLQSARSMSPKRVGGGPSVLIDETGMEIEMEMDASLFPLDLAASPHSIASSRARTPGTGTGRGGYFFGEDDDKASMSLPSTPKVGGALPEAPSPAWSAWSPRPDELKQQQQEDRQAENDKEDQADEPRKAEDERDSAEESRDTRTTNLVGSSVEDASYSSALLSVLQSRIHELEDALVEKQKQSPEDSSSAQVFEAGQLFSCAGLGEHIANDATKCLPTLPQHHRRAESDERMATMELQLQESRKFNKDLTKVCDSLNVELQLAKEREQTLLERLDVTTSRLECMIAPLNEPTSPKQQNAPRGGRRGKREKAGVLEDKVASLELSKQQQDTNVVKLQNQIVTLETQLQSERNENKSLKAQLGDRPLRVRAQLHSVSSQALQYKMQVESLQEQLESTRKSNQTERTMIEREAKSRINVLETKVHLKDGQIQSLKKDLEAKQVLEDHVRQTSATVFATERAMANAKCTALESNIEMLKNELSEEAARSSEQQDRIETLEKEFYKSQETIGFQNTKIQKTNTENDKLRQKMLQLSQVILKVSRDMQRNIDALEKKNEDLQDRLQAEQSEEMKSQRDIQRRLRRSLRVMTTTERSMAEAQCCILRTEMERSEVALEILRLHASEQTAELQSSKFETISLRYLVDGLHEQLQCMLEDKLELSSTVGIWQSRVESLQRLVNTISGESNPSMHSADQSKESQDPEGPSMWQIKEAVSQISSLETANYDLQTRLLDTKQKLSQSQLRTNNLEKSLLKTQKELAAYQSDELKLQMHALQKNLEYAVSQATEYQDQIESLRTELQSTRESKELEVASIRESLESRLHEATSLSDQMRQENNRLGDEIARLYEEVAGKQEVEQQLRRSSGAMVATERARATAASAALESELAQARKERDVALDEHDLSQKENKTLKSKVEKTQIESYKLRKKLLELSQVIIKISRQMQGNIDSVERENDALQAEIEDGQQEQRTANTEIQDKLKRSAAAMIATERTAAEAKYTLLLSDYETLQAELLDRLEESENEVIAQRSLAEANYSTLLAGYESLQADFKSEIDRRENLECTINSLTTSNEELKSQLENSEKEMSILKSTQSVSAKTEARFAALKAELSSLKDRLELVSSHSSQYQKQIELLQSDLRESKDAASAYNAVLHKRDQLEKEVKALQEEITSRKTIECQITRSSATMISTERTMAEAKCSMMESEITDLQQQLSALNAKAFQYQSTLEAALKDLSSTTAKNEGQKRKIHKMSDENKILRNKLLELSQVIQVELQNSHTENRDQLMRIEALHKDKIEGMSAKNRALRREKLALEKEVSSLKESIAVVKVEYENVIESLRAELSQSKDDNDKKVNTLHDLESKNKQLKTKLSNLSEVVSQPSGDMQQSVEVVMRGTDDLAMELSLALAEERNSKHEIQTRLQRSTKTIIATQRAMVEAQCTFQRFEKEFREARIDQRQHEAEIEIVSLLDAKIDLQNKLHYVQSELHSQRHIFENGVQDFEATTCSKENAKEDARSTELHAEVKKYKQQLTELSSKHTKSLEYLQSLQLKLQEARERSNAELESMKTSYQSQLEEGNTKVQNIRLEKEALESQLKVLLDSKDSLQATEEQTRRNLSAIVDTERAVAESKYSAFESEIAELRMKLQDVTESERTHCDENQSLKAKLDTLETKSSQSIEEIDSLKLQIKLTTLEKEELTEKLAELADKLRTAEDQVVALKDGANQQAKASQTRIVELADQNVKLTDNINDLLSKQKDAEATITSLQSEIDAKKGDLDHTREAYTAKLGNTSSQVELFQCQKVELEHQVGTLREELAVHEEAENRLRLETEKLQEALSSTLSKQKDAEATITSLQSEIDAKNSDLDHTREAYTAVLGDASSQVEILQGQKVELERQVGTLREELAVHEEAENRLRLETEKLQEDLSSILSKQKDAETTITSLQSEIDAKNGELDRTITSLQSEIDAKNGELDRTREAYTAQLGDASSQIELLRGQRDEFESLVGTLREEFAAHVEAEKRLRVETKENIDKERLKADGRCSVLESEIADLRTELDGTVAMVQEHQERNDNIEIELKRAEADNKEKRGTIHKFQAQNKSLKTKLMELSQVIGHLSLEMEQSVDGLRQQKDKIQAEFEHDIAKERVSRADIQSRLIHSMKAMVATDRAKAAAESTFFRCDFDQLEEQRNLESARVTILQRELETFRDRAQYLEGLYDAVSNQLKTSHQKFDGSKNAAETLSQKLQAHVDSRDAQNKYLKAKLESQHKDYLQLQEEFQKHNVELARSVEEVAAKLEQKVAALEEASKRQAKADSQIHALNSSLSEVSAKLKDTTLLYSELETAMKQTEQQLQTATEEAFNSKCELETTQSTLNEATDANKTLMDERSSLLVQVEELCNSVQQLEKSNQQLLADIAAATTELQTRSVSHESSFTVLSNQVADATAQNTVLQEKLQKTSEQLGSTKRQLAQTNEILETVTNENKLFQQQIEDMSQKLDASQSAKQDLDEVLKRRNLELEESKDHVRELKKRLSELQDVADGTLVQMDGLKSANRTEIDQLRSLLGKQQTDLDSSRKEAADLIAKIAALEPELQTTRTDKENLEQQIEDARGENADLQLLLEKQDDQIHQFEEDIAERDEQERLNQVKFDGLKESLASVTGMLEEMTKSNSSLAARVDELEGELQSERQSKSAASTQVDEIRAQNARLENEITKLEVELDLVRSTDHSTKEKLDSLYRQAEEKELALENEIDECRKELLEEKSANGILKEVIGTLNAKNNDLQAQYVKLKQKRFGKLTRERDDLIANEKKLKMKIDALIVANKQIEKEVHKKEQRNQLLDEKLSETRATVVELTKAVDKMANDNTAKLGSADSREASLAKEVVGLQLELETIRRKLAQSEEGYDALAVATEELSVELEALKRANQALLGERDSLRQTVAQAKSLKQQIQTLTVERDALRREVADSKSAVNAPGNSEELEAAVARNKLLDEKLREAENAFTELSSGTHQMRETFIRDLEQSNARESSLAKEVVSLQLEIESAKRKLTELKSNPPPAAYYQKKIEKLQADVTHLSRENHSLISERDSFSITSGRASVSERQRPMTARDCRKQALASINASYSESIAADSFSVTSEKQPAPNNTNARGGYRKQSRPNVNASYSESNMASDSFSVASEKQPPMTARDCRKQALASINASYSESMAADSFSVTSEKQPAPNMNAGGGHRKQSLPEINAMYSESMAADSFSVASEVSERQHQGPIMDARACRKQSRPDLSKRRSRAVKFNPNNNSRQQQARTETRQGTRDSFWEEDEMGPLDER